MSEDPRVAGGGSWPSIPEAELPFVLFRAIGAAAHGITIAANVDDQPIVYANGAFLRLTGYAYDDVVGRNCRFLQGPGTTRAAVATLRAGLDADVDTTVVLLNYRRDGSAFWNEVTISAVTQPGSDLVTHYIGTQTDVTERVQREDELARLARTDTLTGLMNSEQLIDELDIRLASGESGGGVVVLVVDLIDFRRLNDDYDVETANLVLVEVAKRLAALAGPGDVVARLEADTFVLARSYRPSEPDDTGSRIAAIRASLAQPVRLQNLSIVVSARFATAGAPIDGRDGGELVRLAHRRIG